jgi:hypothetical protein
VKDKEEKKNSEFFDSLNEGESGQDQFTDEEMAKFSGGLTPPMAVCGNCGKTIDKCKCT